MPSASIITGPSYDSSNFLMSRYCFSPTPIPGPTAIASFTSSDRRNSSSEMPQHVACGTAICNIGMISSGTAAFTSPAPDFSAASEESTAAPAIPKEPATTSTRPHVPLCASLGRSLTIVLTYSKVIKPCLSIKSSKF